MFTSHEPSAFTVGQQLTSRSGGGSGGGGEIRDGEGGEEKAEEIDESKKNTQHLTYWKAE
jgi:hypothetical protein